jgi:hypothetical protein
MTIARKLYAAALLLGITQASAQTDWIKIAEADETSWYVKPGSLEVAKTKGQVPIVVVIGRVVDSETKQVNLYKWYVSIADCQRELGKVVSLKIDGAYSFENDFVFGSGNVASAMAQSICGAYAFQVKNRDNKGL